MSKNSTPLPIKSPKISPRKGSTPTKLKTPYRRTKHPPNYNDRSTLTSLHNESIATLNVYDAVLSESQDLLQAASEAQALGRLKMASSYLLLLHARLVGLGKRFDRSEQQLQQQQQQQPEEDASHLPRATTIATEEDATEDTPSAEKPVALLSAQDTPNSIDIKEPMPDSTAQTSPILPQFSSPSGSVALDTSNPEEAAQQLAQLLPPGIEWSQGFMEHLAKAATDYVSRNKIASARGIPNHPNNSQDFWESTANMAGIPTAASHGTTWTEGEQELLQRMQEQKLSTADMARRLVDKTETQIRAYLKQMDTRQLVEQQINSTIRASRKPVTTAMTTVPDAKCNVKSLLQGGVLGDD